jgi:hypothetical protein
VTKVCAPVCTDGKGAAGAVLVLTDRYGHDGLRDGYLTRWSAVEMRRDRLLEVRKLALQPGVIDC